MAHTPLGAPLGRTTRGVGECSPSRRVDAGAILVPMTRHRVIVLAGVLAVTACSGDDPAASTTLAPPLSATAPASTAPATTSIPSDATTTSTTTSATSPPSTPPSTPPPTTQPATDTAAAIATWQSAWAIATGNAAGDLAAITAPDVAERLTLILEGSNPAITHHTFAAANPDGTIAIEECLEISPAVSAYDTAWFHGTVTTAGDGTARVTTFETVDMLNGCVPADVNAAAITAYEAYWDALVVAGSPPDPAHPDLLATTTGAQLDVWTGLLAQFRDAGQELRGRGTTSPFVSEFSPEQVTVLDCQATDPTYGVYITATGERTDIVPPIVPDQRDAITATVIPVDGAWKVAGQNGRDDFGCDPADRSLSIPVVGLAT